MGEMDLTPPSSVQVRAARRAYYGAISYVDEQLGRLRRALAATGLAQDTVIVLLSDHGEMLGERGLWYKMTFFEGAARIPLVVHAPGRFEARRVGESVSSMDLLPTFLDLVGAPPIPTPIEGRSLVPHLKGLGGHDGVAPNTWPRGRSRPSSCCGGALGSSSTPWPILTCSTTWTPTLWSRLPRGRPRPGRTAGRLPRRGDDDLGSAPAARGGALEPAAAAVRPRGLEGGRPSAWDYQPFVDAKNQYVRSHMPLDDVEAMARFPRP